MRLLCIASLLWLSGCRNTPEPVETITLATTTSTRDSGLLDTLLPVFRRQTGIDVKVVAVGTGQALEMGRRGDADVLLTHAPDAEKQFVADGFGEHRTLVMYNDFVLVGPRDDPANVRDANSVVAAFAQVVDSKSSFVSRGDESGTHMREREIWEHADLTPTGGWYIEAGSGMAQTLRVANEKNAYTLADRGTFLAQRQGLEVVILCEGDSQLHNQYAVIPVNPETHSHVNSKAARRFAEFLTSDETQAMIAKFGIDRFGQPLFFRMPTE